MRRFAYDPEILQKFLEAEFGDRKLGDSNARLLIPSFKASSPDIAVLKTDHHPDYKHDWKLFAWQAALATSAAPTYLPGFISGDDVFLDGGVWANSPAMLAVVEALSAFDIARDQIKIVSIGTGNIPPAIQMSTAREGGLIAWRDIIHTAVYLTTDNAIAQSMLLIGPDRVLRIEPPNEACRMDLDDWSEAERLLPDAADHAYSQVRESLAPFFQATVQPRETFRGADS